MKALTLTSALCLAISLCYGKPQKSARKAPVREIPSPSIRQLPPDSPAKTAMPVMRPDTARQADMPVVKPPKNIQPK